MKPTAYLLIMISVVVGLISTSVEAATDPHDCTYCHGLHNGGTGTLPLTVFDLDHDLCMVCHDTVGNPSYPTAPSGLKSHTGALHTLAGDTTTCWDCHDHFGETAFPNNNDPLFLDRNDYLIPRFRPADPAAGNTRPSRYPLSSPADLTVIFTPKDDPPTNFTYAYGDGTGLCEACHESTLYNTADGLNPHQIGDDCATCHNHTSADGFAPSGCTGCHSLVQDNGVGVSRRAIMPEFDATSHHINWAAAGYATADDIPSEDCEVCHNQATHKDDVVDLNDVDTGAPGAYIASNATDLATFCTKCHDGDGALAEPVPMQPFSDGMKPPTIDGVAWAGNTKHGANFNTGACLECHTSGHGKDLDTLLVVCETCHGATGTPRAATRVESHFAPSDSPVYPSDIPCEGCHTPHTNLQNKFYTDGSVNSHIHYDQGGAIQLGAFGADGYNIMLYGRYDDGDTSSTRLSNPMRIITVGGGPCSKGNTQVEMFLPAYLPDGDGLVFTPMVGDRIRVFNSNDPNFNGYFRILETDLSNWTLAEASPAINGGPKGWICYDNPNTATHSGFGWVSGYGWGQRPEVSYAEWSGGVATLYFSGPTSIRFGIHSIVDTDTINVIGVDPVGFNGQFAVDSVTEYSVSYLVGDPGAYVSGGVVEYAGSVKGITAIATNGTAPAPPPDPLPDLTVSAATWAAASGKTPDRATITVNTTSHGYAVGNPIRVSGISPPGYNGVYEVLAVSGANITYKTVSPNPGAYSPGTGTVPNNNVPVHPTPPPGPHTITVTLNMGSNSTNILDMTEGTAGLKDGDIVRIYGVTYNAYWPYKDVYGFNERWQIAPGGINTGTNPPTITLRCPPKMRVADGLPKCNIWEFWNGYVSGGFLQSTSTLRDTVFDARGSDHTSTTQYLGHDEHSFATQDMPAATQDGYLYGPCELCHTSNDISKHRTIEYGTTHNNGRTCTTECHFHIMGFDKANASCDRSPCFTP